MRGLALGLTILLLAQLLWGVGALWLVSEPDPIYPAASSLQVGKLSSRRSADVVVPDDLTSRPLFWQGRESYVSPAPAPTGSNTPEPGKTATSLDDVRLLGFYGAGDASGIIVEYKGEKLRLKRDEAVGGWSFDSLTSKGAMLKNEDGLKMVELEHAAPATKAGKGRTSRNRSAGTRRASDEDVEQQLDKKLATDVAGSGRDEND